MSNEDNMDTIRDLTAALINKMNELNLPACVATLMPDGNLITRKTDCFTSPLEAYGIWGAAQFQEATAMWNLRGHQVSNRGAGVTFEEKRKERQQ